MYRRGWVRKDDKNAFLGANSHWSTHGMGKKEKGDLTCTVMDFEFFRRVKDLTEDEKITLFRKLGPFPTSIKNVPEWEYKVWVERHMREIGRGEEYFRNCADNQLTFKFPEWWMYSVAHDRLDPRDAAFALVYSGKEYVFIRSPFGRWFLTESAKIQRELRKPFLEKIKHQGEEIENGVDLAERIIRDDIDFEERIGRVKGVDGRSYSHVLWDYSGRKGRSGGKGVSPLYSAANARAFVKNPQIAEKTPELLLHGLIYLPCIEKFAYTIPAMLVYDPTMTDPYPDMYLLGDIDDGDWSFPGQPMFIHDFWKKRPPFVRPRVLTDSVPVYPNPAYYGPRLKEENTDGIRRLVFWIHQTQRMPTHYVLDARTGDYIPYIQTRPIAPPVPLTFLRHINGFLSRRGRAIPRPQDIPDRQTRAENAIAQFYLPRTLWTPVWVTVPYMEWLIDEYLYRLEVV